ncbi:hypothetical protein [Nocardiopsis halophila]|uniref:hypothetical protein n=1 Tax=Nocardiopsis halophila TaxID=141692 RepID=UPI00034D3429|nr:hypothetical protein [Nocardiopsis halophila]
MRVETGAAALLAAAAVALGPVPAAAAGAQETSPAQTIAAGLRESPVYVDPAFDSALPEETRAGMVEDIEDSGVELRVVLVPLVEGDQWGGDPGALAAAVHDRLGGSGHYLVLGDTRVHGEDYPSPDESESGRKRAFYGSLAASYATEYDTPLAEKAETAVGFALEDDPEAALDEQEAAAQVPEGENGSQDSGSDSSGAAGDGSTTGGGAVWPWAAGAAVLLLAVLGGGYLWRRPRSLPEAPKHAAFDNVDRARREVLQERAERELVEVGERLSALEAGTGKGAAQAATAALDAHAAARTVLDGAPEGEEGTADLAGVLVLLDKAEDAMVRAEHGGKGRERRHCYANPLHGTATAETDWRQLGGERTVRVPLCKGCAQSVRTRMRPDPLLVEYEGRTVPYYDVPAEESVWAATGFGTLTDDLVKRVQRGDHRARG